MKRSSRKSERNLPRNTNSNWNPRSAATFAIHGEIAFRWSIFTMNHSYGCCLIARCRRPALSSPSRFRAQKLRVWSSQRVEDNAFHPWWIGFSEDDVLNQRANDVIRVHDANDLEAMHDSAMAT